MEVHVITVLAVVAWLYSSRLLFRHWVRNDSITFQAPHFQVAAMAMTACVFLPVVLAVIFVIRRAPAGPAELRRKIAALEAENDSLARSAEVEAAGH